MNAKNLIPALLLSLGYFASLGNGQVLVAQPEVLILPKGNTFGIQVTCTSCDLPNATESIHASIDDTNYATVNPESSPVTSNPFQAIFNVKGENQGGTILRLALTEEDGDVIAQFNVTIQVAEEFDDDCIFDDLALVEPDRSGMLAVLRQYRDQVLARTMAGRRYSELYYRHSAEVIEILESDPRLRAEVMNLMHIHLPHVHDILNGRVITLTRKEAAQIDVVLRGIESQSRPLLRRALSEFRTDLNNSKKLQNVGVEVRRTR